MNTPDDKGVTALKTFEQVEKTNLQLNIDPAAPEKLLQYRCVVSGVQNKPEWLLFWDVRTTIPSNEPIRMSELMAYRDMMQVEMTQHDVAAIRTMDIAHRQGKK